MQRGKLFRLVAIPTFQGGEYIQENVCNSSSLGHTQMSSENDDEGTLYYKGTT